MEEGKVRAGIISAMTGTQPVQAVLRVTLNLLDIRLSDIAIRGNK